MIERSIVPEVQSGDPFAAAGRAALDTQEQRALKLYEDYGHTTEQAGPDRQAICGHILAAAIKHAKQHAQRRRAFLAAFVAEAEEM